MKWSKQKDLEYSMLSYCLGNKPPCKLEELRMIREWAPKELRQKGTGKIAEMAVAQVMAKLGYPDARKVRRGNVWTDLSHDKWPFHIEVKSLGYYSVGTAPEKIDSIPRKFAHMDKKILVVFCAGMMFEKNVKEIIENKTPGAQRFREYAKDAVADWVTFPQLESWVTARLSADKHSSDDTAEKGPSQSP